MGEGFLEVRPTSEKIGRDIEHFLEPYRSLVAGIERHDPQGIRRIAEEHDLDGPPVLQGHVGERQRRGLGPDLFLARHAAGIVQAEVHGSGPLVTLPQFVDQELVLHDLRVEQVLPLPHREVREFRRERPRDLAALDEVDYLLAREEGLRLPIRQAHPTIAAEQAGDPPEPRIPDEIPHQLEFHLRG